MARIVKTGVNGATTATREPSRPAPRPDRAEADPGQEAAAGVTPAQRMIHGLDAMAAQAQKAVLDARQQAAKLVADARAEADAIREAAIAKGYDEGLARGNGDGYEDGVRKGIEQGRAMLAEQSAELVAQLQSIVRAVESAHAEIVHSGRCDALDFALELAGKIVGRVAVRDLSAARENLRKVLELADRHRELCVKVNPAQLDALAEHLPELVEGLGHSGRVRLAGDESVSPGGAKLQTAGGEIDATIRTQLDNVVEALLGSRTSGGECSCGRYESERPDGAPIAECSHSTRSEWSEADPSLKEE